MRESKIIRKTAETQIELSLKLDGNGVAQVKSGCGFLDHMLTLFAAHSGFDLTVSCVGDTVVDDHHTVEDIGICLGSAFLEALGDKKGIARYGDTILPMDEALIMSAVDISGRAMLCYDFEFLTEKVGTFDVELAEEFWQSFVRTANITLHITQLAGRNSHHIIEGTFKSVAHSLKEAVAIDEKNKDKIPSTKGVL